MSPRRPRPGHETPISGPELHAMAKGWGRLSEETQQKWADRARRSMTATSAADSGQAEYMADRIRRHLRKAAR